MVARLRWETQRNGCCEFNCMNMYPTKVSNLRKDRLGIFIENNDEPPVLSCMLSVW